MSSEPNHDILAEQIAKLLPLLGSDKDGEALAAVRAIGRKLQTAGKDWHWLAEQVAALTPSPLPAPPRPRPSPMDDAEGDPMPPERRRRHDEAAARRTERERPQAGWTMLKRSEALAWTMLLDGQPWLKPAEAELVVTTRASLHDGMAFHLTAGQKRTLSALIRAATDRGLAP